jgi:melibiose permease/lactose/raffinose/galactose permease
MLIFSVGTNVVGGGLSTMYIYFEFGYDGMLTMLFGIGYGIVGAIFTLFYPKLSEKFTRDKVLYSTGICIIVGYLLMLIMGLSIPTGYGAFSIDVLGMHFNFTLKYFMMMLANTVLGWGGGFYMIIVINMANSVEYNEYKTGRREESLIFSLRPFTAKMGSALTQGLVSLVYLVAGVLTITNQISQLENSAASNAITAEQKDAAILEVIKGVPESSKIILLVCMCVIPIVFISIAMIIYKKKTFLNEKNLAMMAEEVAKRKQEEAAAESEA